MQKEVKVNLASEVRRSEEQFNVDPVTPIRTKNVLLFPYLFNISYSPTNLSPLY